jgi:hypothetical protein
MPNYIGIAKKRAYGSKSVCTSQDVAHIVSYAGAVLSPSFFLFDTITFIEPPFRSVELMFLSYVVF